MEETVKLYCDNCGKEQEHGLSTEIDGELEITWLSCHECGKPHLVSITDEKLRKDIRRYGKRRDVIAHMHEIRKVDPAYLAATDKLHDRNVLRSNALKEEYLANRNMTEGAADGSV